MRLTMVDCACILNLCLNKHKTLWISPRGGGRTLTQIINLKSSEFKGAKIAEGYCVKCKAKKEMKDPEQITMKNGRPATKGTCPDCGTKMFKIGKA